MSNAVIEFDDNLQICIEKEDDRVKVTLLFAKKKGSRADDILVSEDYNLGDEVEIDVEALLAERSRALKDQKFNGGIVKYHYDAPGIIDG